MDHSSVRPGMRVWLGEAERNIKENKFVTLCYNVMRG
jgi:hypothetical protein